MDYSHFKMGFPNLYYHFNASNMHIWVILLMKTDSFLFSIIFILFNRKDETGIFGFSCPQYNVLRKNCLFFEFVPTKVALLVQTLDILLNEHEHFE